MTTRQAVTIWLSVVAVSLALGYAARVPAQTQAHHPRMEFLGDEELPHEQLFKFFHDKDTGQEIICYLRGVDLGYAPSCWPTGRKW